MLPTFSSLINPTFDMVLDLESRFADGDRPDLVKERERIEQELRDAEATATSQESGIEVQHFRLAKYALVCWADEVLTLATRSHGPGHEWREICLEVKLYGSCERAWRFYARAEQARKISPDALEVFYLAVVLGFRGDIIDAIQNPRHDIQEELLVALRALRDRFKEDKTEVELLKQWAAETYSQIAQRGVRKDELPAVPLTGDVRPLQGSSLLRTSCLGALSLLVLLLLLLLIQNS